MKKIRLLYWIRKFFIDAVLAAKEFEIEISKWEKLQRQKEIFPFITGEICFFRNHGESWRKGFFDRLERDFPEGRPFHSCERDYQYICKYEGNQHIDGTFLSPCELWTQSRIEKAGLLNE